MNTETSWKTVNIFTDNKYQSDTARNYSLKDDKLQKSTANVLDDIRRY